MLNAIEMLEFSVWKTIYFQAPSQVNYKIENIDTYSHTTQ